MKPFRFSAEFLEEKGGFVKEAFGFRMLEPALP
jgi:hypothetical protein